MKRNGIGPLYRPAKKCDAILYNTMQFNDICDYHSHICEKNNMTVTWLLLTVSLVVLHADLIYLHNCRLTGCRIGFGVNVLLCSYCKAGTFYFKDNWIWTTFYIHIHLLFISELFLRHKNHSEINMDERLFSFYSGLTDSCCCCWCTWRICLNNMFILIVLCLIDHYVRK